MNIEERNIELIERYLEGELSPGELGEFEQRLKNEPGLDEEIEVFKILTNGIRYSGQKSSMRDKLEKLEASLPDVPSEDVQSEEEEAKVVPMWRNRMVASIAATFLILAVSTYLVMDVFSPADHEELFAQHFQPYPIMDGSLTRTQPESLSEKQLAYVAYEAENFKLAIKRLEALLAQGENAALMFYLGNAYLASGDAEQAIVHFDQVLESDSNLLIPRAKYYLSLCYLKMGNIDKSKEILEDLKTSGQSFKTYSEKAEEILRELD